MEVMVDDDAAFLWETEALRTSPRRVEPAVRLDPPDPPPNPAAPGWVTLRDAHYETGIPVETLRKWARRKNIPSSMEQTEYGTRRMVSLDDVIARAHALGRPLAPVPSEQRDHHESHPPPESDLPGEMSPPPGPQPAAAVVPEGTVLVPIAAWDKMLMQLGNLHEAGQQLAEARERAAKAETEAKFLRERLREVRETPDPEPSTHSAPPAGGDAPTEGAPPEKMWRYVYRGWSRRRKT
jgi:hypothetical protein